MFANSTSSAKFYECPKYLRWSSSPRILYLASDCHYVWWKWAGKLQSSRLQNIQLSHYWLVVGNCWITSGSCKGRGRRGTTDSWSSVSVWTDVICFRLLQEACWTSWRTEKDEGWSCLTWWTWRHRYASSSVFYLHTLMCAQVTGLLLSVRSESQEEQTCFLLETTEKISHTLRNTSFSVIH